MENLLVNEHELKKKIYEQSFFRFVQAFWSTIITEKPVWNFHIEKICGVIQEEVERVIVNKPKKNDLLINQPPSTTKSTVTSIMLPAWCWARKPQLRLLFASHGDLLGDELATKTKDLITSPLYQSYWDVKIRYDQNKKVLFENQFGGQRQYCTVKGKSPTGRHFHIHVVDDPVDPQSVTSAADIRKCDYFLTAVLPQRKIDQSVTLQIMVMQRIHPQDPSGVKLKKKSITPVRHICLPAELGKQVRPKKWKRYYKKGLLDPKRLPAKVLIEKKELGQFVYSGQFLQMPIPLSGGMFRVSKIRIEEPPQQWALQVRYWDKAATQDDGCYTVGLKMAKRMVNGIPQFWVLSIKRGQWESNEREAIIKQTTVADGKTVKVGLEQEGGSGGKESAEATVRRLSGYRVELERPTGDKLLRADEYSVQVNAENVFLAPGDWNSDYLEELEYAGPAALFMDQVDASSGAFRMLTKPRKIITAY